MFGRACNSAAHPDLNSPKTRELIRITGSGALGEFLASKLQTSLILLLVVGVKWLLLDSLGAMLVGMALLTARLGIWQLDRLEQRRARNAEIVEQLALPPLPLNSQPQPADLTGLKYRRASILGEFDFGHQVALKNQNWMDAPGIHLITPLIVEGTSQAVLIDRGWLPLDQAAPESWEANNEAGPLTITGFIQTSQTLPGGRPAPTSQAGPQSEWYWVDIQAIQAQMPYELLPVYVLESPPQGMDTQLPYQVEPEFDLSEGSHLGYAIQWFIFALILGIIYVSYVNKKEKAGLVNEKP